MKRTIGILLDHRMWKKLRSGRTGREKVSFYNRAARKLDIKLLYFSLPLVDLHRGVTQAYRYHPGKGYKRVTRQLPKVIHNRSMSGSRLKLAKLCRRNAVFNERTRYSKYTVHSQLWSDESLRPHLPSTKQCNKENLKLTMDRHPSLYLKPVSSSVGKGIMRLDRLEDGSWQLIGSGKRIKQKRGNMIPLVMKRVKGKRYLISETIPLARYKGQPFDIRVSVQKADNGKWQVTGMVGKVAAKGSHVTNVARGGKVRSCEQLFAANRFDAVKTRHDIERVSIQIAKRLAKKLGDLADLGLDIGLDHKGNVYFIEMNGRDLRYSFGQAGLDELWYRTYENPLRYGKYLLSKAE
ncbi:hypothetical protein BEP19_02155 [Ammoniphilus oxalaticus]|uniref:ATP-grasp domain-containing protein n=1 Tax=Ammoniphilus oxalaticus TaxID=66863 RepID=A0A419SN93_9BACL|nr:YheC/YheD family protein [Ammoniphilus oxalaticus]RKD25766.1 hypothetical protein BEP19_02155 [Ammoniphilus oxalaticus]